MRGKGSRDPPAISDPECYGARMLAVNAAAVVALFSMIGCAAAQRAPEPPAPDPRELLALEQRVMEAIRTRDVKALEQLTTEDFVLREPAKPELDRRAFLKAVRAIPGTIEIVSGDGVRAKIERGGEVGMITGIQRVRVRLTDGTVVEDASAFADLCVRRDGRWRMSVAFNASMPERKR